MATDPYVFTTELGEPCDPRNALRALKAAAKRAGMTVLGVITTHPATALQEADLVVVNKAAGMVVSRAAHQ